MNLKVAILCSLVFFAGKLSINAQSLPAPTTLDGISCGAGNLVLTAESNIQDPNLIFDWYQSIDEELQFLGSVEGPEGASQFITPFLIQNGTFHVRIRLNDQLSPLAQVTARVENTATVFEAPRIELCGSVELNSSTTFDPTGTLTYQWQVLTAQEDGEALFVDILDQTASTATLAGIGFYRIIISRDDGCEAVSTEVEVTDDRFLYAQPLGEGEYCFQVDNQFTHTIELTSEYGRDITEYIWEESNDGVAFSLVSTDQILVVTKGPAIVTNTTVFYRLTVREQNCFELSDVISVDWVLSPSGTISHADPGIGTADFFYCGTDIGAMRTLEATSAFDVSISWIRGILIPGADLDFIKGSLRTLNPLDPATSGFFEGFDVIGSGASITLEQEDGGLIFAVFTDNITGCESYSDNAIFADTAFPFPLTDGTLAYEVANLVCMGEGSISFDSYDESVDNYSWQMLVSGSFVEIGSSSELLLDATLGSVAGSYRLEVSKNGCVGQSDSFSVFESTPPEAAIQASKDGEVSFDSFTICPGEELFLASINISNSFDYRWVSAGGTLGDEEILTVDEAGTYFLEITNGACVEVSAPFVVTENPVPATTLNLIEDPDLPICKPVLAELTELVDSDTYQWFFSENNLDFVPVADEVDSDYFISVPGFFYVGVTNSIGCSANSDTLHIPAIVIAEISSEEVEICGNSDHALLIAKSVLESNTYVWFYSPYNIEPYVPASGVNNLTYYQAFDEGYYTVEATNETCSAISEPSLVVLEGGGGNGNFEAVIDGPNSACLGSSVTLTSSYQMDQAEYFWLSSANGINYQPVAGEISGEMTFSTDRFANQNSDETLAYFKVGVSDLPCSSLSEEFVLRILRSPVVEVRNSIDNGPNDLFYCTDDELGFALEAFQISTNLELSYQWSRLNPENDSFEIVESEIEKSFTPTGPGRYRCDVTTLGSECSVFSNEIDIVTLPTEVVGDTTFCLGSGIELEVEQDALPTSIFESFNYQWFHAPSVGETSTPIEGETGSSISIDTESEVYGTGLFSFQVSTDDCTKTSAAFTVTENENSFEVSISGITDQFRGIPFELEAVSTDPDIALFTWEPGDFLINSESRRVVVTVPETFENDQLVIDVSALSTNGCTAVQSITILLSDVPVAVFPKLVTPNGDGLNDFFVITGFDLNVSSTLKILNNWGIVVYETRNYNNDPVKSARLIEEVEEGVYYYLFESEGLLTKGVFYVKK